MHRDVGAGVALLNPFGELPAADGLGFEQGAVAIVDVLKDAIEDVGPQLLVVGVGELVVDDLGEDAFLLSERLQRVEFLQ
jgi:hypothetical protein